MITASLELLEFEGVRALVGRYVHSAAGEAELARVEPSSDRAALEEALADVREALEYIGLAAQPQPATRGAAIRLRFDSVPDVAAALQIVAIEGGVLEPAQVYQLTQALEYAGEVRGVLTAARDRFPRLAARAARMLDLRDLLREVRGKVLPDGTVADDASVALHRIRRDIEKQQKQIQISLERFVRAHRDDGVLQEDFVTLRNDRFVVPVVAGQQRHVEGVIHGASGTGHTLFIEPLETIALNNDVVRLREEEQREVQRILLDLTERFRGHAQAIAETIDVIGELELLFAKAQFAQDFDCTVPVFSEDKNRRLVLEEARHPLLQDVLRKQGRQPVPLSLTLDDSCRVLLISGPNTGGKTVGMKTVGLLSLMAQAALPVPAAKAEFPIFEKVLADIGDQQSIQENLSTFSAHIEHIRAMLAQVTRESLVLLDELGRATDPEEGGALGVAILDAFRSWGAFTLASTHLTALKVYGANTETVLNASMGFDEHTLQPTYVLQTGAPGKSAGLEIAARLGLPSPLIDRARSAMTRQEQDLARLIGELHDRLGRVAQKEKALEEERQTVAERERTLEREWERREKAKLAELEARCDRAVAEFEARAQETIDRIAATAVQRKALEQAQRQVSRTRREFREQVQTAIARAPAEGAVAPARPVIEEGSRVRLRGVREPARVRRKLAEDRYEVEAGFLKMQVSSDDIEAVLEGADRRALPEGVSLQTAGPAWNVTWREINVIGKHAEEARDEVDKFLDNAAMASVDRVRIVHGHGMGILRRAIAELLAENPHVAGFHPAPPSEGGTGATIVDLK